jgi:hypothetical protein
LGQRLAYLLVAGSAVLGVAAVSAPAASACNTGQYCYSYGYMPANIDGVYGSVCETSLSVSNPYNSHVTSEIWIDMNSYWSEGGIVEGHTGDSNGTVYNFTSPTLFWADKNTQYGFNVHPEGGAASGGHYGVQIWYSGAEPWWNVDVNGHSGNSWHQASYATELQTGAEFYDGGATVYESGAARSLEWQDLNGNWWSPWGPVGGGGGDAPLTGFWYQTGSYYSTRSTNEGWSC